MPDEGIEVVEILREIKCQFLETHQKRVYSLKLRNCEIDVFFTIALLAKCKVFVKLICVFDQQLLHPCRRSQCCSSSCFDQPGKQLSSAAG